MHQITGLGVSLCLALTVSACASDSTGPKDPSQGTGLPHASVVKPLTAPATVHRSVKGSLKGSDQYGDSCGDGQGILIVSTGRGTVSHFGNALMVSTSCVNLADFSVIGEVPFSIEAANGDQAGGFLSDVVFTSYGFDLYTSISWGTGRFEGATGEVVFPTVSTYSGTWTSGVEGWINY